MASPTYSGWLVSHFYLIMRNGKARRSARAWAGGSCLYGLVHHLLRRPGSTSALFATLCKRQDALCNCLGLGLLTARSRKGRAGDGGGCGRPLELGLPVKTSVTSKSAQAADCQRRCLCKDWARCWSHGLQCLDEVHLGFGLKEIAPARLALEMQLPAGERERDREREPRAICAFPTHVR